MSEIYKNATQVFVRLGPAEDDDLQALQFICWLNQKHGKALDAISQFLTPGVGRSRIPHSDYLAIHAAAEWSQIWRIVSYPWFSRVWVIQEFILAKKPVAQRGHIYFDLGALMWILSTTNTYRYLLPDSVEKQYNTAPAHDTSEIWCRHRLAGPIPLFAWARCLRAKKASDRRDLFFALVGISHGVHPSFVDYTRDFRSLAIQVGAEALHGHPAFPHVAHGLDCLAFNANPQNRTLGIPSWVPDWFSDDSRGRFDLGTAFSRGSLIDHPDYQRPDIRGFGPTQPEDSLPSGNPYVVEMALVSASSV